MTRRGPPIVNDDAFTPTAHAHTQHNCHASVVMGAFLGMCVGCYARETCRVGRQTQHAHMTQKGREK